MPFQTFKDAAQQAELSRERSARLSSTPWSRFQFVDVVFTGVNTDVDIVHTLNPTRPDDVRWVVVGATTTATPPTPPYRDGTATAKSWSTSRIWLRTAVPSTMRLMLFLES